MSSSEIINTSHLRFDKPCIHCVFFFEILNVNNIVSIEQSWLRNFGTFCAALVCFPLQGLVLLLFFSLKCLIYCKLSFLRFSKRPCYSQFFVTSFLFVILFCSTTYILIKYLRSMLLKLDPLIRKDSIYTIVNTWKKWKTAVSEEVLKHLFLYFLQQNNHLEQVTGMLPFKEFDLLSYEKWTEIIDFHKHLFRF